MLVLIVIPHIMAKICIARIMNSQVTILMLG